MLAVLLGLTMFSISSIPSSSLEALHLKGEKIKFDVGNIGEYSLIVKTPSNTIIKRSDAPYFILTPEEEGFHEVKISNGNIESNYEFMVVGSVPQKEIIVKTPREKSTSLTSEQESSKEIQETIPEEVSEISNKMSESPAENSKVKIGESVTWKKKVPVNNNKASLKIPELAENISISENAEFKVKTSVVDHVTNLFKEEKEKSLLVETHEKSFEVAYETPGPEKIEKKISKTRKEVKVISPVHYTNVEATSPLEEPVRNKHQIKIYWVEEERYLDFEVIDSNADGLLDEVIWNINHLSEQTFIIIIDIVKAVHLDENREFVKDIFSELEEKDGIWISIPDKHYVRVTFERELSMFNDITVYARGSGVIEVYEHNQDKKIAELEINGEAEYKTYLGGLEGSTQEVFDLRILGDVELDYVIDPTLNPGSTPSLKAQIAAEQNSWPTQDQFPNATDGAYPAACGSSGDRLSCDDGIVETATSIRITGGGGFDGYGGVNITTYNSAVDDCNSINQVFICYEFWGSSSQHTCTVGVDANGGASWSNTGVTCSATAPGVTCTNVTASETWTCGNFFGLSGTRAMAKAQAQKTAATGTTTWSFDALYFNVSYSIVPAGLLNVLLNSPSNGQYFGNTIPFQYTPSSSTSFVNCSLWDNSTGAWHLNQTNSTNIINATANFINRSYPLEGFFTWNIQCCDSSNGCAFASSNRTFTYDVTSPVVSLISPVHWANSSSNLNFTYNASENKAIGSCSLVVDDQKVFTSSSIVNATTQFIEYYLDTGIYSWTINCTDLAGNEGTASPQRTLNVTAPTINWQPRLYETATQNYTSLAQIELNNTRDSTENSVIINLPSGNFETFVRATSAYIGKSGAFIEAGTVTFSGVFSTTKQNQQYITWKVYVTNNTGDILICQNGDDGTGGTKITTTGTATYTNTCTTSQNWSLLSTDRIKLVVNVYNADNAQQTVTHLVDSSRLSYVEFANLYSLGSLLVNLTFPVTDQSYVTSNLFNATCNVTCLGGTCLNTQVYIQYNTSSSTWVNISSSGNIILGSGETNPHSFGSLNATPLNTNFSLNPNLASVNNLRCAATSTYSSYTAGTIRQITITAANEAPNLNLSGPANNNWSKTSNLLLFYNVSDDNNQLANCSLYINGAFNLTNSTTVVNGAENNFSFTAPVTGQYNWSVGCFDSSSLENRSTNRTFYFDNSFPQLNLIYPTPGQSLFSTSVDFNFTVNDTVDSILLCNLTMDSSIIDANFNAINASITSRTNTISIGTHFWNVTCMDDAHNFNTSATRNFTIQDIPPSVVLTLANLTWFNVSTATLTYNASDNNALTNCSLYINGAFNQSNSTVVNETGTSNFTYITPVNGPRLWAVNCTDANNLFNYTPSRLFYIDTLAPNLTLNLPANSTTFLTSSVNFNFTATENLGSITCGLTVGIVQVSSIIANNASLTNRLVTNLVDGPQTWNVSCTDNATNYNYSEIRIVNITEFPLLSLNTANGFSFNTPNIVLNYTPSDNTGFANCSLQINGAFNQTNQTSITNGAPNNFTLTSSAGTYNWSVRCFDTFSLLNQSSNRSFSVDLGSPNITLWTPLNGADVYNAVVEFNYTMVDDLSSSTSCNLTVNSVVQNTTTAVNNTNTTVFVALASGGLKYWNVTCIDDAKNIGNSPTFNFTLFLPPNVTLISPSNNSWTNQTTIDFFYNVSDGNDDIVNSTISINGVVNQTNSSNVINNEVNNFTIGGFSQGAYTWNVQVSDAQSLVGTGALRFIHIDTEAPRLTQIIPFQDQVIDDNNITFNFSVFDNLDSNGVLCNITIGVYGDPPDITNISVANNSYGIGYAIRSDANYTWFVDCLDEAKNVNRSREINFSVEAPPKVYLNFPNQSLRTKTTLLTFNYTVYDAIGITSCDLYLDGVFNETDTTISFNNQSNIFTPPALAEGTHTWLVNCTDSDSNVFTPTPKTFSIDFTPPNITLNNPSNQSSVNANYPVSFSWTATDNLDSVLICDLRVDGVVRIGNQLVTSGTPFSSDVSGLSAGNRKWNVTCKDTVVENINISEERQFNYTYPDLEVNSTSISFNESSASENQTLLVNTSIQNKGSVNQDNVRISFYSGDPDAGGKLIGQNATINVSATSWNYASTSFQAAIGTNQIYVVADPPYPSGGTWIELNETNNKANKSLSVESWHFFYGLLESSARFTLQDSGIGEVITWNQSTSNKVNIYVTDSDSSIEWTQIQAIGRDISGGLSSDNDFAQIDSVLNMSSFLDSVNKTYTFAGQPNETTNYTLFGRNIGFVPLAPSINDSDFKTGILWDMSDNTGDDEYDSTDREDLIFFTNVSQDTQGSYDIVDYELRVPALLRAYKSPASSSVGFYIEIYG